MVELRVYGVRHHGPGSARALMPALAAFAPDCVLVEGPPDADDLIHWLAHPALEMPVALLIYRPEEPQRAVFYPFAAFSPEYRALRYGLEAGVTTAFFDLARRHTLAITHNATMPPVELFRDLAGAAGYESYEGWWNAAVEQGTDGEGLFAAVMELASEMRRAVESVEIPGDESPSDRLARQREAAMRERIRRAAAKGHRRIAAVCGAWHAPALVGAHLTDGEADEALLGDLPSVAVDATWVPWTYGRLAQGSGYGAGIASPGWYDHLWAAGQAGLSPTEMSAGWLAQVAALLRAEGMDTSPGHSIETVRLAEALAAMRGRPYPGLPELEEAILSVMCGGREEPLQLIRRRLIVGERMGMTPPGVPAVPLQRDLAAQQARLKLRPEPEQSALALDLRQETDMERSRLLHRLALLGIPWGVPAKPRVQQAGTYAETWTLQWLPDLSLKVVEAAIWGNTVRDAAAARVGQQAAEQTELPPLIELVDRVIQADLPEVIPAILTRIEELAVVNRDGGHAGVAQMLAALPPLADVLRYGGLRQTAEHLPFLRRVFDHLLTRSCLALPGACVSLDDKAAADMMDRLSAAAIAVRLVAVPEGVERWTDALVKLADRGGVHPVIAGRAARLLFDESALRSDGVMRRLERALTPSGSPDVIRYAAGWLDGFLRDSGLLLIHDHELWGAVDKWLIGLSDERFQTVMPLLRRTFSTYPEGIRRQLQDRSRRRGAQLAAQPRADLFDEARAAAVLPLLGRLLARVADAGESAA